MTDPTADDIRDARRARQLTQTQAAALVHVTDRTWRGWEAGDHPMPLAAWELFMLKGEANA